MNHLLLIAAAAAASAGIAVVRARVRRQPVLDAPTLLVAAGALATALVASGVVLAATGQIGPFGVTHLLYLGATVSVPATAVGTYVLTRRLRVDRRRSATALLAAAFAFAPVGVYATHIEPFWLRVDRVCLELDSVETPLRIAVLSDLQTPNIGAYERDAVATMLAEQPDIVLIPGDFWQIPGGLRPGPTMDAFHEVLVTIDDAVDHVVAVRGDADDTEGWRALAQGTDVVVLHNELAEVEVAGQALKVAGLVETNDAAKRAEVLDALAAGQANTMRIVLAHHPDAIFDLTPAHRVDLVVAGHTHGGQIVIPLFGPPLTLSDVPRSVAAGGLHEVGETSIYVSTGVGRERGQAPQVRFLARPSIGILDVT